MNATNQFESIRVEVHDGVGHLILNCPQYLNVLSMDMLLEIGEAMTRLEGDQQVRVIVLSGAGNGFSSGFDLTGLIERRPKDLRGWRQTLDLGFCTAMRFWHSPKPTVAAVHGACEAGAFEMALACDITIASEDSFFGALDLRSGAGIVTMQLLWMMSPKHAKRIIFSGQGRIGVRLAMEMGLVSEVTPPGEHLSCALRVVRSIARMDSELVQQAKMMIQRAYDNQGLGTSRATALDIDYVIDALSSSNMVQFMDVDRVNGLKAAFELHNQCFEEE